MPNISAIGVTDWARRYPKSLNISALKGRDFLTPGE